MYMDRDITSYWLVLSQVHFDCLYRNITAVSSRESKLLAGNRSIAQVLDYAFVFVCGQWERERELSFF